MQRELPVIDLHGTAFILDVINEELRQKENTENIIPIKNMSYQGYGKGYLFSYDPELRNIPSNKEITAYDPAEAQIRVAIPELAKLDPAGMAQKYGLKIDQVQGKTDFELTITRGSTLDLRWNKGILPTLHIDGHTFFVDLHMNKLRPKDDFASKGIDFDDLPEYFDHQRGTYIIPYNPKKHELEQIDYSKLTGYPENQIIVEFPWKYALDPVSFVKTRNLPSEFLPADLRLQYHARVVPWEETRVIEHIKKNVAAQLRPLEDKSVRYTAEEYPFRLPTDTTRVLPEITIHNTTFTVDVNQLELRDKNNLSNIIVFKDLLEKADEGYKFWFGTQSGTKTDYRNADAKLVEIPDFVQLDPQGMAKKHNITFQQISKMTDFDLFINKSVLNKIFDHNILPQIEIQGHTFFVDSDQNKLVPKDDIWSPGIIFSEIAEYYSIKDDAYIFPYNPRTHSFEPVNLQMHELPKDLIVIQIPHESALNPVWNNNRLKNKKDQFLKRSGVHLKFTANVIPWNQTLFSKTVQMNQKNFTKSTVKNMQEKQIPKSSRGRKS